MKSVWFLELHNFTAAWADHRLTVEDFLSLQDAILADPRRHPVIAGIGGLRKIRFAPRSSGRGKRGAFRVCYALFDRFSAIVLVFVYGKNEMKTLPPAVKKTVKKLLVELEQEIEQKMGR